LAPFVHLFVAPEIDFAMAKKTLLSWSSGKDSVGAPHLARNTGVEVVGLMTTME
jgi:hypothetical protein